MEKSLSLTAKLKTKNAANKIKHGSPKLQEVLRQRCRQRMKEKRSQLFQERRRGLTMETDEDIHEALTEIIRSEFSQLATQDIDGKNSLFSSDHNGELSTEEALALESEILAEEEQWIFSEFERFLQEEANTALFVEDSLKEIVICPLCERGSISDTTGALACTLCDLRLPVKISAEEFGKILQNAIVSHSSACYEQPGFAILPDNDTFSLYMTCDKCSTFTLII